MIGQFRVISSVFLLWMYWILFWGLRIKGLQYKNTPPFSESTTQNSNKIQWKVLDEEQKCNHKKLKGYEYFAGHCKLPVFNKTINPELGKIRIHVRAVLSWKMYGIPVCPKSANAQTLRNDGDNLIINSPPSAVCCIPCVHHLNLYSNQTLLPLFKEHTSLCVCVFFFFFTESMGITNGLF